MPKGVDTRTRSGSDARHRGGAERKNHMFWKQAVRVAVCTVAVVLAGSAVTATSAQEPNPSPVPSDPTAGLDGLAGLWLLVQGMQAAESTAVAEEPSPAIAQPPASAVEAPPEAPEIPQPAIASESPVSRAMPTDLPATGTSPGRSSSWAWVIGATICTLTGLGLFATSRRLQRKGAWR
jgi:hypothetical protein